MQVCLWRQRGTDNTGYRQLALFSSLCSQACLCALTGVPCLAHPCHSVCVNQNVCLVLFAFRRRSMSVLNDMFGSMPTHTVCITQCGLFASLPSLPPPHTHRRSMSVLNDMFGSMPTGFQQALHKYAEVRRGGSWLLSRHTHPALDICPGWLGRTGGGGLFWAMTPHTHPAGSCTSRAGCVGNL